jgi:two-component system sensor histidine kinase BarA
MDVQMPGMDGRQSTETIRQWESERHCTPLPIVALTAHAMANEKRALLQSGMDDYLTKPISERQLAQVVLKWTGLACATRRGARQRECDGQQRTAGARPRRRLRLAAGKADLAADMLAMLLASLEADREAIRAASEARDQNALIERVHRLHGATRYCGVPQLRGLPAQRNPAQTGRPESPAALEELERAINRLATQARISA